MTFSTAISSLRSGYAAKRPSWKGFVKRIDLTADNYTSEFSTLLPGLTTGDSGTLAAAVSAGVHKLVFVYATGASAGADPHEATYLFDNAYNTNGANDIHKDGAAVKKGSSSATVFTDYAPLTQFLLEAILRDDWETGLTADFEAVASGGNEF